MAISSLLFGPIYGIISAVSVATLETLTFGGDTQVYGLIMNIISSGTFVVVLGVHLLEIFQVGPLEILHV